MPNEEKFKKKLIGQIEKEMKENNNLTNDQTKQLARLRAFIEINLEEF